MSVHTPSDYLELAHAKSDSALLKPSVILDIRWLCREGVSVSLPGLGRGEVTEDPVSAQTAAVVERLDEVEDVGSGSGPVGPDAGADLFFEQGPETLRGGIVETRSGAAAALTKTQLLYPTAKSGRGVFAAAVAVDYAAGLQSTASREPCRVRR
nr:hypothetical protein [Streptomyces sp. 130]